jgi:hypothetical protein
MDITLWEASGHESRKLRIGQYVLLDQLVTSDKHESGNKRVWYVNGSVVCGTRMFNGKIVKSGFIYVYNSFFFNSIVSTLSSLLSSPSFRLITPLWHAKETKNDHFQIEGIITGWELHLNSIDHEQFVLSDVYSSSQTLNAASIDVDFMDLSIGDRITAAARKV